MQAVPDASHYNARYLGQSAERLTSYRMQVAAALDVTPERALVVGKGDGLVPHILQISGVEVATLDIQSDLNPDICASVLDIPLPDASYDAVLCCQVLEHLPFTSFGDAVRELSRVTRSRLIISVPDQRRWISLNAAFGKLKWRWGWSFGPLRRHTLPQWRYDRMGHFWEIGYDPVHLHNVLQAFEDLNLSCRVTRNPDFPYHTFFLCDKPASLL